MNTNQTTTNNRDDEAQIRRRIEKWSRALEAKDVDGLIADYAPDAIHAERNDTMQMQQKITPFLSLHSEAEEAANFYVSVLPDSKIVRSGNNPATGTVITVELQLADLKFVALNVDQS